MRHVNDTTRCLQAPELFLKSTISARFEDFLSIAVNDGPFQVSALAEHILNSRVTQFVTELEMFTRIYDTTIRQRFSDRICQEINSAIPRLVLDSTQLESYCSYRRMNIHITGN